MEIKLGQPKEPDQDGRTDIGGGMKSRGGKIPQGATVIAKSLVKKSVMINSNGDQIDPVTKQIIKRKED
jgi:hypothetical protein